jgi:hypothetical protein
MTATKMRPPEPTVDLDQIHRLYHAAAAAERTQSRSRKRK